MKKKPFWKYLVAFVLLLALFFLVVFGLGFKKFTDIQGMIKLSQSGAFEPPPTAVTTEVVQQSVWQPTLDTVGSLAAVNGVTVSTDLAGIVAQIAFNSGDKVKAGDLLVALDTKQENAQLHQAEAQRDLAGQNLKRYQDLLTKRAISQADFDATDANYRQMQATVEQYRALIARKTLRAPFDGVIGIRQANLGQFLNNGDPVVTLQSFDPIYANFNLPQQDIGKLSIGQTVQLQIDAYPKASFEGKINAINSLIDQATRNVQVQATLQNAEGSLRPGMFCKVSVSLADQANVIAVPATSIHYAPYGDSVFVVSEMKNKKGGTYTGVREQFVRLGATRGDLVAVVSGLKAGEEIVTSGVFRLKSGGAVTINNSVKPENELAPTPAES